MQAADAQTAGCAVCVANADVLHPCVLSSEQLRIRERLQLRRLRRHGGRSGPQASYPKIARPKGPKENGKGEQRSGTAEAPQDKSLQSSGAPSEKWILNLPEHLRDQVKSYAEKVGADTSPKQKKAPTHAVEAERVLNKTKRALEAATKRCDETEAAIEKLQQELAEQEQARERKQEAVTEATACYSALCAKKLSTSEQVLVPSSACFQNTDFANKFAELKTLPEKMQTEMQAKAQQEQNKQETTAGGGMEVDAVDAGDLQASVDQLLSDTPEQDRAAIKRAVDDLMLVLAAKKARKDVTIQADGGAARGNSSV